MRLWRLASGIIKVIPVDWSDIYRRAEILSKRHTNSRGYRGFDILHIATALHLDAQSLLSFDTNQIKLARAENLKIFP